MKVLISIGTLGLGGAEKQAVWLANSLSEEHQVTLVTYHGGKREEELSPKVIWKSIFEIWDKEEDEDFNSKELEIAGRALPQSSIKVESSPSYEVDGRERESVKSIFRLMLLEEKVKTSLKNFPLTFKLVRYLYSKSMPLVQIVRLHLITKLLLLVRRALPYLTLSRLRHNVKSHIFTFRKARKLLRSVQPNLVITFLFHDTVNIGLAAIAQVNRPKLIVGRRSPIGYGDDSRSWVYKLILRFVYRFSDLAVSNSESNIESAIHDGLAPSKIVLINNFVNSQNLQLQLNNSPVASLICIANFFEYKNHRNMIQALGMINEDKKFEVTFVGEGPTRDEMLALTKELKLNAFFYTHEEQMKLRSFKADFLVLPSFVEGSSNALLEGLAKGIPAIVTNVGLVPTLKKMGAPIVVSKGIDAKSLEAALREGLSMIPRLRREAEEFKKKVECEFSEKKILMDWLKVIGN